VELEGLVAQMLDVLQRSRIEVVEADDPMPLPEQMLAEVRPEKAGAAGDYGWAWSPRDRSGPA
jgi:hypothetical protein